MQYRTPALALDAIGRRTETRMRAIPQRRSEGGIPGLPRTREQADAGYASCVEIRGELSAVLTLASAVDRMACGTLDATLRAVRMKMVAVARFEPLQY